MFFAGSGRVCFKCMVSFMRWLGGSGWKVFLMMWLSFGLE